MYFGEYSTGNKITKSLIGRLLLGIVEYDDYTIYSNKTLMNEKRLMDVSVVSPNQAILLRKITNIHNCMKSGADEVRKQQPNYMLYKEYYVTFSDIEKMTNMVGDYLKTKKYYATYKNLTQENKNSFVNSFSYVAFNIVIDKFCMHKTWCRYKKHIIIPLIKLYILITPQELHAALDIEMDKNETKFKQIGIHIYDNNAADIELSII